MIHMRKESKKISLLLIITMLIQIFAACGTTERQTEKLTETITENQSESETNENDDGDTVLYLKNMTEGISVTSKSFFPDYNTLFKKMNLIRYGIANGKFDNESLASEFESAIRELQQLGYYYDYIDKTFITDTNGNIYGARADDKGPIGGGEGYKDILASGKFLVNDDNSFYRAVKHAKDGDIIYIKSGAVIDISDMSITDYPDLQIKSGVTIASDRGEGGKSGGMLVFSLRLSTMFTANSDVRITGLVLQGNDPETHEGEEKYAPTLGMIAHGSNIEIDNCEISGFNSSGISADMGNVYIHHCYIHHIKGVDAGNGVLISGSNVKLEYNLFSNCRYAVTINDPTCGKLEATNNVEVGNSIGAMFCIKSDNTVPDKAVTEYSGETGVIIKNNTVLGYTQPIEVKGAPQNMIIENNLFSLDENMYDLEKMYGKEEADKPYEGKSCFNNNLFNILCPYISAFGEKSSDTATNDFIVTKPEKHPAAEVDYGYTFTPAIISNTWYGNAEAVLQKLVSAKEKIVKKSDTDFKNAESQTINAITELGSFSLYFKNIDKLSYEIDGVKYGAYTEDGEAQIGGGIGYNEIITSGDYNVNTFTELVKALSDAKSGEVVFIDGKCSIDISSLVTEGKYLDVKSGVTLASNRGFEYEDGTISTGAKIYSSSNANKAIYAAENSKITGINLEGGDPNQHLAHHARAFSSSKAPGSSYYYKLTTVSTDGIYVTGNNVEISNCEISGFGHAGIYLAIGTHDAHVSYCYIHHCQANGLGYGICHNDDATSVVEYNMFNYNRHSIAGTGAPQCGYIARFNIEMGSSLSHCFDMHGGSDRKDGTNIAGTVIEIYNNTFLADTEPYHRRGVPEDHQIFFRNVCRAALSSFNKRNFTGENMEMYDNVFSGKLIK